ncbi:MAG: carbohydrate ABC transporter permease [Verrucomicrobiota bacterium]
MAIISNLDRRTKRGKLMLLAIYALLFLGAIGMVYPFLLMLRMTTSNAIDRASISVLPEFLWNRDLLSRKYLSGQYRLIPTWQVAAGYGTSKWSSFDKAKDFWNSYLARFDGVSAGNLNARVEDLAAFAARADLRFVGPALRYQPGRTFEDRFIVRWLAQRDNVPFNTFRFFEPVMPDITRRDWTPPGGKDWRNWRDWLGQLPGGDRFLFSSNAIWQRYLMSKYGGDLNKLNSAHRASYSSFNSGPFFAVTPPADGILRKDWEAFASERYPLFWQELPAETVAAFSATWKNWLAGTPGVADASTWQRITGLPPGDGFDLLPAKMPDDETVGRWWCSFVNDNIPLSSRILLSSEVMFGRFLRDKYETPEALSAAWGQEIPSWEAVRFPIPEADFLTLTKYSGGIKWEVSTVNFRVVTKSLLLEGRAFSNTLIIVLLAIATSLTVNPLAAYALSRFRMRGTSKILIFLLATMALPAEVAMVPGFLLVRDLHLTDTFWALVLPHAANAFSIFLLKGFFDSLPQELYEAALIDGAGEFTLFTRITLPLSMPIIAVTLLSTTTHAYNLFMPAVMYIGDVNKWPIATKIYEINQISPAGVGMAALVLSSIFPLLVFVFCQRIIMRGIILPSMK